MDFLHFNPELDFKLLLAVPLIPLIGYTIQIFLGRRLPRQGDWMLTGGMGIVMCITLLMAAKALYAAHLMKEGGEPFMRHSSEAGMEMGWLYSGAKTSTLNIVTGIFYDPLGAVMLAVVGVVSFCVHLFSIGYMHGDRRYHIFFANISLFTVAMLGLVLSDNILFLFIFWELMGLMSYLLIGHFSQDPSTPFFHRWATWASKKAFMTTRVGDTCLLFGMILFYVNFKDLYEASAAYQAAIPDFQPLRFTHMWEMSRMVVADNGGQFPTWMTVAGLFAFGGTMGKSAQFPLHIWLPDAMAGPTPVSAMIHAATMVAAGVFLLGRIYPLMSPDVLAVVTVVGATTAFLAATIGLTSYDLKAVLAWSTISQLGFMVAAVGLGGVAAGMFHMVTHAFFKACLFLSAGSVIHGCHHMQDMRMMGGLRKKMPVTFWCMTICTCAIAGVPFFSGFYSKDMILLAGWANLLEATFFDGWALYALGALAVGAMLTAFYMFRLIFMTFFGEYRGNLDQHMYSAAIAAEGLEGPDPHEGHDDHGHDAHDAHGGHDDHGGHGHEPHEAPLRKNPMTIALVILTLFAIPGGGYLLEHGFTALASVESMYGATGAWVLSTIPEGIADHHSHVAHDAHKLALILSLIVASAGIIGAWYLYVLRRDLPARITQTLGDVYLTVRRRYFVDEFVDATVIRGTIGLALVQRWIDENVIDGMVNFVGWSSRALGFASAAFDRIVVDGSVNLVGNVAQTFGSVARLLQTGRVQQYVSFAVAGGLAAAAWLILS
jgi:proton-translocating NADH-quinone oxidoreductase chain L